MKILHTSDWHLGRTLYGRKRYEEFSAFLDWLIQTIEAENIDILLVAGDIFDTSTPSNQAQELYYRFLSRAAISCCRHVVIIAGNHDSPSFLNAPKKLLQAMNIHIVSAITDSPADEVITLYQGNRPEAIVCAIPYLRDRDIRTAEPGETIDTKNAKLIEGLKNHYTDVCAIAEQQQTAFKNAGYKDIPIIAMGHLFTAGGRTVDDDGVRELYVGSLIHINKESFPPSIDYLALGHLHVAQKVAAASHIRYSGSPLPMGYGEATQKKQVIVVDFNQTAPEIREREIPCFQELIRIAGSLETICSKIESLKKEQSRAWLEIEYTGKSSVTNLREIIDKALHGSSMEIRRLKNRQIADRLMNTMTENETLDDLSITDVFTRCLDVYEIPQEEREELTAAYNEIVQTLQEEDANNC